MTNSAVEEIEKLNTVLLLTLLWRIALKVLELIQVL
jgi:hypothetical protein